MAKHLYFFALIFTITTTLARADDTSADAKTKHEANDQDNILDLSLSELLDIRIGVASSHAKDTVFTAPSTVSVIDRETIEKFNFQSVAEAVEHAAGFQVLRTHFQKNLPTARGVLQTHYANKVLVMIDKIPLWHASTGEGSLERIGIDMVERIEILRGPASVLYGSNAYSGAINIVTRHNETTSHSRLITAEYGKYSGSMFIAKNGSENLNIFIGGVVTDEDGKRREFSDETGIVGRYNDKLTERNITGRINSGEHTFTLNTYGSEQGFLGLTTQFRRGGGTPHKLSGQSLHYLYEPKLEDKISLQFSLLYDRGFRRIARDPVTTTDGQGQPWIQYKLSDIEGVRSSASLVVQYEASDVLHLSSGLEYENRESIKYTEYNDQTLVISTNSGMKNKQDSESSVFLQADSDFRDFKFSIGSRYTDNQTFGSNTSSRATAVYIFNPMNSLKLIYGQSFRSPSIFELRFTPTGASNYGNSNLKPEKSDTLELAYLTSVQNIFLQTLIYQAQYNNLIIRSPHPTIAGATQNVNGKNISAHGIEIELRKINDLMSSFFNFSYNEGSDGDKDASGQYTFKFVPRIEGSLGASYNFNKKLWVSTVARYFGETKGPSKKIPSQWTPDLNLGFKDDEKNGSKITHILALKSIGAEGQLPEYVRRKTLSNEVPYGNTQTLSYSVQYEF